MKAPCSYQLMKRSLVDAVFPLHRYKLQHQVSVSVCLCQSDMNGSVLFIYRRTLFINILNAVVSENIQLAGFRVVSTIRCYNKISECILFLCFFSSSNSLLRGGTV